jgi:TRAP-type C4-dicarboxylate transport system permease small subunit
VQRGIDWLFRGLEWLMVVSMAVMVVLVFGNVVMRYGFNSGLMLSEELSRWLFVWMTFLGAVVALNERAHLGTDSLISRLPPGGKKVCLLLTLLLMLFLTWLVFLGSYEQVKINWASTSAVMETSMGYFYASGLVFSVLSVPVLLLQLFRLVTGRMSDAELVNITDNEDVPHGDAKA